MATDPPGGFELCPGAELPQANAAVGVVEKLSGYCLAAEHPVGRHKARVFRGVLGFEQQDADELAARLLTAVRSGAPVRRFRDNGRFGVLCDVRIVVDGVRGCEGRRATVVTVWELRTPIAPPRLVTAYVDL